MGPGSGASGGMIAVPGEPGTVVPGCSARACCRPGRWAGSHFVVSEGRHDTYAHGYGSDRSWHPVPCAVITAHSRSAASQGSTSFAAIVAPSVRTPVATAVARARVSGVRAVRRAAEAIRRSALDRRVRRGMGIKEAEPWRGPGWRGPAGHRSRSCGPHAEPTGPGYAGRWTAVCTPTKPFTPPLSCCAARASSRPSTARSPTRCGSGTTPGPGR
jgi:hypothetical protein